MDINTIRQGVDYQAIAEDQRVDVELQIFVTTATDLTLENVVFENSEKTVLCDVSTAKPRPLVP